MSNAKLNTVKVVNEDARGGFMIINESEFDNSIHTLFNAEGSEGSAKATHKGAGKWEVSLANGEVLEESFDKAGAAAKVEELNADNNE